MVSSKQNSPALVHVKLKMIFGGLAKCLRVLLRAFRISVSVFALCLLTLWIAVLQARATFRLLAYLNIPDRERVRKVLEPNIYFVLGFLIFIFFWLNLGLFNIFMLQLKAVLRWCCFCLVDLCLGLKRRLQQQQ